MTDNNAFPLELFLKKIKDTIFFEVNPEHVPVKRLKSKRNVTVEVKIRGPTALPNTIIVKMYIESDTEARENEYNVLQKAMNKGILVPRVILRIDEFLLLEKIKGENLCDLVNSGIEFPLKQKAMIALGTWMAKFHSKMSDGAKHYCRGDANLRNFIFTGNDVVGLDFEDARYDNPLSDLCGLIDSILITNPGIYGNEIESILWKFQLVRSFLRGYITTGDEIELETNALVNYLDKVLVSNAKRRGKIDKLEKSKERVEASLMEIFKKVLG